MTVKEFLEENNFENVMLFDRFDDAFCGVNVATNQAIYDYEKLIDCIMKQDNCTAEDAIEYIDYNCIYSNSKYPIVMYSK